MTPQALKEILELHGKWLRGEEGGKRANLADANLDGAYLVRANLDGANLDGAYLVRADLDGAYLAAAYLAGAYLAGANLAGANLARANLAGANLAGANLARANLDGAYLVRANLDGAYLVRANLDGAYLADANLADANLAGANLAGANLARAYLADAYLADANLAGANLVRANLDGAKGLPSGISTGAEGERPREPWRPLTDEELAERYRQRMVEFRERHPDVPVVEDLDRKILDEVEAKPEALDMSSWHHSCGTTHCRGGWAIVKAGEAGAALEREHGEHESARMIYLASTGRVPHFFATNERALQDLRRWAGKVVTP